MPPSDRPESHEPDGDRSARALALALSGATDTRALLAGEGVLAQAGAVLVDTFGPDAGAVLVADTTTWEVAGAQVQSSLRQAQVPLGDPLVLPGMPTVYAGYENVERVREHLRARPGVPVAIGSGTLNDLVKLAASELGRPSMVVGTAASMDGYAAYGASISIDGFKNTRYCPAPAVVVADYTVMAAAPGRLTASGFGDLIEKVPAGADWMIADALGVEAIDDGVWHLVQDPLRASLADPDLIAAGELGAISRLADGLLMSGLAMQAHRSSRPASGAGHQFSHLWEMEGLGLDREPPLTHGMKVGLGTIALCALYEVLLRRDLTALDIDGALAAWPSWEQMEARVRGAALPPPVAAAAVAECRAKYLPRERLRERLLLLVDRWPSLSAQLAAQLLPASEIEERLRAVGAVTHPSQIGLGEARFRATHARAQLIRSRYTVLDLLVETNLLRECVAELFAPGGFWSARPWS
ncbi:sn-glycerol-1-phosphate dehydrogenase [Pseudactinotalea terrae]|uniref:sn-glycerol-1-phosphate dehydrogenase n=1 Tax=Pseudactinotalea terrae TaxID=1743262 RepID=UPI001F50319D|nr:sn-glycerol-1-phosphate dehydrogenase [Pseudactinotalea terrae]